MINLDSITSPTEINLLISFFSLNNYSKLSQTKSSKEMFSIISDFFELTSGIIEAKDGKIIKWTGDGALAVFQEESVGKGITALMECRNTANARFKQKGLELEMVVKANFGQVTCGRLGTKKSWNLDIIGTAVNTAARLASLGFAITPQVYEKLDSKNKGLFKANTSSGVYAVI
jgi:adenylate cyclase